jgi:hypothetical protein
MSTTTLTTINGTLTLVYAADAPQLTTERVALDVIAEALQAGAELVIVPVDRLGDDFIKLRTGLAGQIVQKFTQYRRRLVILGDITPYTTNSPTFKSFVYEANHGDEFWFLPDMAALETRLQSA